MNFEGKVHGIVTKQSVGAMPEIRPLVTASCTALCRETEEQPQSPISIKIASDVFMFSPLFQRHGSPSVDPPRVNRKREADC